MGKKSYKQLQNRLYREIKRRIIAEQSARVQLKLTVYDRKIDVIKARQLIDCGEMLPDEFVKKELVRIIANKLYEEGYIEFYNTGPWHFEPIYGKAVVEARINVSKGVYIHAD